MAYKNCDVNLTFMIQVKKIAALTGHAGSVYSLCLHNKEQQQFFSTGGDGNVVCWNFDNLEKGILSAKVASQIFSMLHLSNANRMLLGQMQGGIHVLDLESKKEIKHLAFHQLGVFDLQTDVAEQIVLAAGGDGVLSLWSTHDFQLLKSKKIADSSIRCIVIDETHEKIYAGCSDHCIYVLHYKTFEILHQWKAHQNSVFALRISPCGKFLLSGSRDAFLSVWEIENNYTLINTQAAHLFTINDIVYHPLGYWFATAGRDKHIKIWDATNFKLLKVIDKEKLDGHVNSVNRLLWHPQQHILISCSDDRSIMLWQVDEV
jgi:WD40 repeat protein